ncbi:MAG: hypothetical protein E7157_05545 [Lactobacillales bacterium]|nr:hypothetical protein [Lactobacillales bacterium]
MELIFEFIIELLFEGVGEASQNKKISKFIRYPLIALIVLAYTAFILLFVFMGVSILKDNMIGGIIIIAFAILFLILSIKKFKETYMEKKKAN